MIEKRSYTSEHNSKKIYLECLRIIAMILVIFNHTGLQGYTLFTIRQKSVFFWGYLFCSIACKIAVPLFFMISGSLLLPKQESIRTVYQKRLSRFVVVLLLFSAVQMVFRMFAYGEPITLSGYIEGVYAKNLATAYWYLYAYLGVLVMLPLLRRLAQGMTSEDFFYYAFCELIIVGVIPVIQYLIWQGDYVINGSFAPILITNNNVFFFLLGYGVEHTWKLHADCCWKRVAWTSFGVVAIGICCFMTYYLNTHTGDWGEYDAQFFHNSLIVLPTIAVFLLVKELFESHHIPGRLEKVIIVIGNLTFCIMLVENIFRYIFEETFLKLAYTIGSFPSCILYVLTVFVASGIVALILKRIPLVKKII